MLSCYNSSMHWLRIIGFIALITAAHTASAVTLGKGDYVPIAPIPMGSGGNATSGGFAAYLNTLFQIALAAGATLAAIFIAIGGFEYITSEATEGKKDGKMRIIHALYGLAVLLGVTLLLYVINPDAICLTIFEEQGSCSIR